jgi:hypothetical protein
MKGLVKIFTLCACSVQIYGQALKVEKYFEWYRRNHIIISPTFAYSDTEFVFSRQFYIPDGGSAIGREEYLQELSLRAKTEKRFADPVVSILNINTKEITEIDYGWTPSFSKDDKLVLYTFQAEPITGYRVLAKTLKGNEIKIYNRTLKSYEVIAVPGKTFLTDPCFFDSVSITYKVGEAVNGSYGDGAGINIINLAKKQTDTLLKAAEKFGNYPLAGSIRKYKNTICYTLCDPVDSFTYRHLLVSPKGVIIDFGKGYLKGLDSKVIIDDQSNVLYLDDDHTFSHEKNFLVKYDANLKVSKKQIKFRYHQAYLSLDGKYMFYQDYNSGFYLVNLNTSEKAKITLPNREVHSVTWFAGCRKFAIVQDHEGMPDTDKISLFDIK